MQSHAITIRESQLPDAIDTGIQEIAALLRSSAKSYLSAGQTYVALLGTYTRKELNDRIKLATGISDVTLLRLERVGRGICDERLLVGGSCGMARLAYAPIEQQREAMEDGIRFLTAAGSITTLRVDTMSRDQAAQAISASAVRSVDEQRAYLAAQKPKENKPAGKAHVKDGKIYISGKCSLTRYEIATLLAQME